MGYQIERLHGEYNRTARSEQVRFIVVHYTGSGTSSDGAANANCRYFAGGNRQASAHYFVDDGSIWEYADPSAYATWHCGDGGGRYGITNGNSIGIEVCQSGDRPYTEAETDRLAWLVRKLMADFGVPAERVVRHYDASRKACPYYYTPSGSGGDAAWAKLHERITGDDDILTESDIKKIAEAVWNFEQNGTLMRDRVQGTDEAANSARYQLTRTDDPSGRGIEMDMPTHLKYIAAKLNDVYDMLAKLEK